MLKILRICQKNNRHLAGLLTPPAVQVLAFQQDEALLARATSILSMLASAAHDSSGDISNLPLSLSQPSGSARVLDESSGAPDESSAGPDESWGVLSCGGAHVCLHQAWQQLLCTLVAGDFILSFCLIANLVCDGRGNILTDACMSSRLQKRRNHSGIQNLRI